MKKVRTIRIDKEVSDNLDSICTRHGDVSFHIENALAQYGPVKKSLTAKPKAKEKVEMLIPDAINLMAWSEWTAERKMSKKPITPTAAKKQFKMLAQYTHEVQQQIIDSSIANNYQGLFAPKSLPNQQQANTVDLLTDTSWANGMDIAPNSLEHKD